MTSKELDPWYTDNLVCPVDHIPLEYSDGMLVSSARRQYPIVDGIPVMLLDDVEQTHRVASASLRRAQGDPEIVDQRAPELHLESIGLIETGKKAIIEWAKRDNIEIDPVVDQIIGATNGHSYKHLIGNLPSYPIPELRLPFGNRELFLDLGCNWGRWCIAATRKGYTVVGIDPSLGAVMAARRVAKQLQMPIKYLVADARFLPFSIASFNVVFSYSVLQHLSKNNVRIVLDEVARVLQPRGTSYIQMPNFLGIRSLQHQARRRFREAHGFEVRYWSVPELKEAFTDKIGDTTISVDCYFGLGLQKSDIDLMTPLLKFIIKASEALRFLSTKLGILKYVADSVYLKSIRRNGMQKMYNK